MIINQIRSRDQFAALEADWRELEPRLARLPFVSFDWTQAWWDHLRAQQHTVRDRLCLYAFHDAGGKLRGVAPMMSTERPGYGPLRARQLQFFGADPNITEVRTIAAAPEDAGEILQALLGHLRDNASHWDFMQLTGVLAQHADTLKLHDFSSARWVRDIPNYYLKLAPTWEEFKTKLSRNVKESLRKCYNAPKRDGLQFHLEVVREPAAVRAAVAEFLRLHQARADRDDGVPHLNVFWRESSKDFLFDVCQRFAARDRLRIFQLKLGDKVVATRIGFCCQESLYLYYSGYDTDYSRYSIMTTAVAEAIQYAIREGFQTVNLSTGNDVSKLRWSPEEAIYREALLVSPSLRGTITHESYTWLRRGLETDLFQTIKTALHLGRD